MQPVKALLPLLLLCASYAHATACPTGYSNGQALTIAHTHVAGAESDYPLLLAFNGGSVSGSITLTNLKASGSGGVILSSGNDIVFCDAAVGGNLLSFERATYVGTTGMLEAYVDIASLSATVDTNLWMFYGKASDTDHSNVAATWVNYMMVCHEPDGTTLNVACSVQAASATNSSATATTGAFDGAFAVTGGSHIDTGASYNPAGAFTLEAWTFQTTGSCTSSNFQAVMTNFDGSHGWWMYLCSANGFTDALTMQSPFGQTNTGSNSAPFDQWNYMAGVYTGTANFVYINAVQGSTANGGGQSSTSTGHAWLGNWPTSLAATFKGSIDEIRISSVARDANWITTQYANQSNPAAFMSITPVVTTSPARHQLIQE